MTLISKNNFSFSEILLQKIKTLLLLAVFTVSSLNVFSQTSSLISACGDFVAGPNATWTHVLVATTVADGAVSQGSQTYTMNVTSLPAGGANVRVFKTTSNGSSFFGGPVALTLGSNSITVGSVAFNRAVKFQFSSGDVEFDALSLNGVASSCAVSAPPASSLISACGDFVSGASAWPYVLVATTVADGAVSQGSQTFTMNITSLPSGGANVRVYKTTANGNSFLASPVALTLGSNSITVAAVAFNRAVKFQFSSGDVEFDDLSLNGISSTCVGATIVIPGCTDPLATNYDSTATIDDSSCTYPPTCGAITGVNMTDIIDDRATFNWDNMNGGVANCDVDQIRIQYREVGTSAYSTKTMGAPVGNNAPALNTSKRVLNLSASTQYEYDFKIWYLDGTVVTWHAGGTFTTAAPCDNVTNVTATPTSATATDFCWTAPSTAYSFARLKYREDVAGSSFSNIGGMGVMAPALCKTKNGINPGLSYRVMWRTWCNPSGGPYRSAQWDGPVLWSQPTSIRVEGGTTINNLDVYPNPSRDIFNVSFTSEDVQNLDVRIINVIGEVVYTDNLNKFVGEYTKQVNLSNYTKGVYFLEITTDNGVINKKIILQ